LGPRDGVTLDQLISIIPNHEGGRCLRVVLK